MTKDKPTNTIQFYVNFQFPVSCPICLSGRPQEQSKATNNTSNPPSINLHTFDFLWCLSSRRTRNVFSLSQWKKIKHKKSMARRNVKLTRVCRSRYPATTSPSFFKKMSTSKQRLESKGLAKAQKMFLNTSRGIRS